MEILYKALPVFWWIAIWELTDLAINWLISNKKQWRIVFYIGMLAIIGGILYFDDFAFKYI